MDGGECGGRSEEEDAGGRGPSASAQALGFAGDAGMLLLLLIYARAAVRIRIRAVSSEVLKFNKHGSIFVLFDKKFLILD
jgi:hypothetical protein